MICALAMAMIAYAPGLAADLPARPRAVLARQLVPEVDVSVVVRDVATGESLVDVNSAVPRPPASTMKLLPTWAALDMLGPAYTWKTRVWADAPIERGVLKGNLYLQGGGDPLLTIERWWRLVSDLRQRGLRVIDGDVVIDQTRYVAADERPEDFDGRPWRTYNVLPDAMLVNWQSSEFTIRPGDDGDAIEIRVQPFPEGLVVENRVVLGEGRCVGRDRRIGYSISPSEPSRVVVSGRLARSCPPQTQRLAIMDPAQYAYGTFVTLWREQGGEVRGGWLRAPTPSTARLLLTHESPPLADIVRVTNKFSSNMMARSLVLAIGAEKHGLPASTAAGEAAIHEWLAGRNLVFPELVIGNGSGLSREARLSADSLARLLGAAWRSRYAPEFLASLALGGLDGTLQKRFANVQDPSRIRMKTGSLRDVSTIAGYVTGDSGRSYAVVIFAHHPGVQNGAGETFQAALVDWVLRQ
ncbi:MAG TPA: D-alanyl-D-alanine carboxypeptidase/D-alanyl-D-alanine-endopeptidase [Steroidobacteraceae bacterium]|nr:D-alanyl-D-alanine carboxypeptidase/D-alanyl-D-alanine-endopeptidase [Steroidobacteraceae bacterium]